MSLTVPLTPFLVQEDTDENKNNIAEAESTNTDIVDETIKDNKEVENNEVDVGGPDHLSPGEIPSRKHAEQRFVSNSIKTFDYGFFHFCSFLREKELTDSDLFKMVKRSIATLESSQVDNIKPGKFSHKIKEWFQNFHVKKVLHLIAAN